MTRGRVIGQVVLAVVLVASLGMVVNRGTAAQPRVDPYEMRSAVLTSKTSDQVTIFVGGLRSDFHLQPAAQVLLLGGYYAGGSAFLYNPGAGPDGLLTWSVSNDKIVHHFTPMPVNGRYRPFVGQFDQSGGVDIFWYAPGSAGDHIWWSVGNTDEERTDVEVGGDYRPVVVYSRPNYNFEDNDTGIIWYEPGPGHDELWDYRGREVTVRPLTINGYYQPIEGDFDLCGIHPNNTESVFWYSQTGRDYLWCAYPGGYSSQRTPDAGPGFRPVAGEFVRYRFPDCPDVPLYGFEDIYWFRPGTGDESYWLFNRGDTATRSLVEVKRQRAGSVDGDYRPYTYGLHDVLFVTGGTKGALVHMSDDGPAGSFGLTGLPPNPVVASASYGSEGAAQPDC